MLLETFILAVIIGLVAKGSLKNLAHAPLHGALFIWAGLVLRNFPALFKLSFLNRYADAVAGTAPVLFIFSFALLIFGILLNLSQWPMILIFSGILLNFAVVLESEGFMPVSGESLRMAGYDMDKIISTRLDMNHVLITAQTKLAFLADIIPIPRPYPFPQILSVGDVLMCLGLFFFIVMAMAAPKKPVRYIVV